MLHFDEAGKEKIKADLQEMIAFVDKLKELDTTDVEPLMHMSHNVDILRNDEPSGMISQEEALKNSPDHDRIYFKVPQVIKKPTNS